MARDFGNSISTATGISVNRVKPFANSIGNGDRRDFLSVNLSARSQLTATLSNFDSPIRISLLDQSGTLLKTAAKAGKTKIIDAVLDAGTYIFRLLGSRTNSTTYRLKVSAAAANSEPNIAPAIIENSGSWLDRGQALTLNDNLLKTIDPQQSAEQLIYTLSGKPTAGLLKLNGIPLTIGDTFTQADINAGRLAYNSYNSVNQLTQNDYDDGILGHYLVLGADFIAWAGFDGNDYEVYRFDGNETVALTDTPGNELVTGFSGNTLIWSGQGGSDGGTDYELFFYDGTNTHQLTSNDVDDLYAKISGLDIAWMNGDAFLNGEIRLNESIKIQTKNVLGQSIEVPNSGTYFYRDGLSQDAQNMKYFSDSPKVVGNRVVFTASGGSDRGTDNEVFFYDGQVLKQLTQNSTNEFVVSIDGNNIAWNGEGGIDGGPDAEIFLYDGKTTRQLTVNDTYDHYPSVSGLALVWVSERGLDGGQDPELFLYDGTSTRQITQTYFSDFNPRISSSLYVWLSNGGADGGYDNEIFFGSYATSDRFSFTVSDGAGGTTNGSFVFNIT